MSIIDDALSKARIAAIKGRGAVGNQLGSWLRAAAGNTDSEVDPENPTQSRAAKIARQQTDRLVNAGLNTVSFGTLGTAKALLDKAASVFGTTRLTAYLASLGAIGIVCVLLVFATFAPWISLLQMLGVFPTTDDLQVVVERCSSETTNNNDLTCEQEVWREQCEEYKINGRWPVETDCQAILNSLTNSSSSASSAGSTSTTTSSNSSTSSSSSSARSTSSSGSQ